MLAIEMPRKDTKLRLDERILSALREKAEESGMSFNALCETILFSYAKSVGKLPPDAEPLPEARGGARPNAGKRKKSENDDRAPSDDEEN
ncbi:hypothetical protein LEP3755_42970 [Leptolyngbya sp. NIES-3755]|nr:hypothetical protein LEP3755_42970 [Leptolyngbya sp. NIES-3755]